MIDILVNKDYPLDRFYVPKDLLTSDNNENNFHHYIDKNMKPCLRAEALYSFILLQSQALNDGLSIIIDSGYRSYDYQKRIWDHYVKHRGLEYAKKYVAHPGTSEHQTGLALDIATFYNNEINDDITEESDEYKWMISNAHKYGFILRYPKNKELITGYNFEPWHYRYVGAYLSSLMKEEDITLEEYHNNNLILRKKM